MRILFLCHRVPYPPDKGDRIRSYHVLRRLCEVAAVDVAFLADEPIPDETIDALRAYCDNVHVYNVGRLRRWGHACMAFLRGRSATEGLFHSRKLNRDMNVWRDAQRYDVIVIFSSSMVPYATHPRISSRVIADLVDVDSEKFLSYANHCLGAKSLLYKLEGKRVRKLEHLATNMHAVILATDPEAALFKQCIPNASPEIVQNGVDLEYFCPRDDVVPAPNTCVFMGTLDYHANVTGLNWFCEKVWPEVRSAYAESEFRIVGRRPVARVRALGSVPGVNVIGEVPDVRPWLRSSCVAVAPLLVARGVQNKVLEAMACGVPVIGTRPALDGLSIRVGVDALEATTPEEWVAALRSLWDDAGRQRTLGCNARQYVERCHVWQVCLDPLEAIVRSAAQVVVSG